MDWRKGLVLVLMGAVLVVSYTWLQGLFDDSDLKKGMRLVRDYHAGAIEHEIERRHAGALSGPLQWEPELLSGFWGHVRVHCRAPFASGALTDYQFDANVSDFSIHPGTEDGKSVLEALAAVTAAPAASAATAAPAPAAAPAATAAP
jgi:hypothetical protein